MTSFGIQVLQAVSVAGDAIHGVSYEDHFFQGGGSLPRLRHLPWTARLPGFLSSCEGCPSGSHHEGCSDFGFTGIKLGCCVPLPPSVDAIGSYGDCCSTEANFSHSTFLGGAATLSCQLQVSHDGALILLVPVLDYSASLVRDGASLFTRIWDIPFS